MELLDLLFRKRALRRRAQRCAVGNEATGACCEACAEGAEACPCEASATTAAPGSSPPEPVGPMIRVPLYATTGAEPTLEPTSANEAGPAFELRARMFRQVDPQSGDVAWLAAGSLDGPLGRSEFYAKVDERTMKALYGVGRELAQRLARKRALRQMVEQAEGACAQGCETRYGGAASAAY